MLWVKARNEKARKKKVHKKSQHFKARKLDNTSSPESLSCMNIVPKGIKFTYHRFRSSGSRFLPHLYNTHLFFSFKYNMKY